MQTGLTLSPQANPASPAVSMFLAALMSLSWLELHSGQVHERTTNGIFSDTKPQQLQRLDDGYHLSMPIFSKAAPTDGSWDWAEF